jgi:hypothetical protein
MQKYFSNIATRIPDLIPVMKPHFPFFAAPGA